MWATAVLNAQTCSLLFTGYVVVMHTPLPSYVKWNICISGIIFNIKLTYFIFIGYAIVGHSLHVTHLLNYFFLCGISLISTGYATSRAYPWKTTALLQGIHLFHNCLCSHFMEFINLSAFHPLLTYFFPVRQGRRRARWEGWGGSRLLVLLTAQTDGQYHGGCVVWGCGGVWQTCITHVSHNCRMKVNGLALQCCVHFPLPLPLFHPHPLVTSVARSTTNPSLSPCCLQHHVTRVSRVANWFSTLGHVF